GFLRIDGEDERLPASLDAARVEIHLDEAVDGIDGRGLVGDPRNVVLLAVALLAGAIPLDERAQRVLHRLGRVRDGVVDMPDDLRDLLRVTSVDLVDLLDELS